MADSQAATLDGYKTLTGETLIGALNRLDEKLPAGAYKKVSIGGKSLTDISPAYSLEFISQLFGPLGVGWGYTVDREETHDHTTSKGNHYKGYTLFGTCWYIAVTPSGEQVRVEWQTYGGNANAGSGADEHFSAQGAVTNLIGKGWSMQGFQRTIYKGEDFGPDEPTDFEKFAALMKCASEMGTLDAVKDALGKPKDADGARKAYCLMTDTQKLALGKVARGEIAAMEVGK